MNAIMIVALLVVIGIGLYFVRYQMAAYKILPYGVARDS